MHYATNIFASREDHPLKNSVKVIPHAGKRVLIIKLASIGDVLRTTAILPAIRKKYPNSHLTWLAEHSANEVLAGNRYIERILIYSTETYKRLMGEEFNLVVSLDKAKEAIFLASLVKAKRKYGFGMDNEGKLIPFNSD